MSSTTLVNDPTAAPNKAIDASAAMNDALLQLQQVVKMLASGATVVQSTGVAAVPSEQTNTLQMDPRLQWIAAQRRQGTILPAATSTGEDEIAVIARVTSVEDWESLSEARIGATIGEKGSDGTAIVTGRIPVRRIENVRKQPFVVSLKAAQPLRPMLYKTTEEILARPQDLPALSASNGGEGAIVGVIDYGADFVHKNFRNGDGTTRFLSIWHQGGTPNAASPLGYGREYNRAEIDAALAGVSPYSTLGYSMGPSTHGTHVLDIAAGNGLGSGVAGVAPKADIIFVDVISDDIPFVGPEVVRTSFGDSTRLLEAVNYIFTKAGDRPCVINVSLGTNGGPHDGTTPVEDGIDRLLNQKTNRALVIAASNSFGDGIHAQGKVTSNQYVDLIWTMTDGGLYQREMEVWYSGKDRFAVELIAPDGVSIGRAEPGDNLSRSSGSQVIIFVANRLSEPNNRDNVIGLFLHNSVPAGDWRVRLHAVNVTDGSFHAWIERDDSNQSQFAPPHDNTHTIGSVACGQKTIVVGSYDAYKSAKPLSWFSSAGPTRDGREKPEISAPGHGVNAAKSLSVTGTTVKSGTSMASPAVAGIVALLFAEAAARGVSLKVDDVRNSLMSSARRLPPPGTGWHDRYGRGRASARDSIGTVMMKGPVMAASIDGESKRKSAKAAAKKGTKKKHAKKAKRKVKTGKKSKQKQNKAKGKKQPPKRRKRQ